MFNDAVTPDEAIQRTIAALISEGGARFLPELVISAAPCAAAEHSYDSGDTVETHIAGVSYDGRQDLIRDYLSAGDKVLIVRNHNNAYDENALIVTSGGIVFGYVPAEIAADVSAQYPNDLFGGWDGPASLPYFMIEWSAHGAQLEHLQGGKRDA